MTPTTRDPKPSPFDFRMILEAARRGDRAATEVLFRRFYPGVERMVHRSLSQDLRSNRPWLNVRFSTGDVVQDVFRSLLRDLSGFEGDTEGTFSWYLAMVVRNRLNYFFFNFDLVHVGLLFLQWVIKSYIQIEMTSTLMEVESAVSLTISVVVRWER